MKPSPVPHLFIGALLIASSCGANTKKTEIGTLQPASVETTQEQQLDVLFPSSAKTDVIESQSVWGASIVADTGTNHSSAKPTFGKVTSKPGECVVASPTEYISEKYLDWVWQNRIGPIADLSKKANWNVMANKNFHMDKLVHNNGTINYCVGWDAKTNTLNKNTASKFQTILERHFNAWNDWLVGYNCWPFTEVKVKMVGWAAKQASQFGWADESLGNIYEGHADSDGVPQCPDEERRSLARWFELKASQKILATA